MLVSCMYYVPGFGPFGIATEVLSINNLDLDMTIDGRYNTLHSLDRLN